MFDGLPVLACMFMRLGFFPAHAGFRPEYLCGDVALDRVLEKRLGDLHVCFFVALGEFGRVILAEGLFPDLNLG